MSVRQARRRAEELVISTLGSKWIITQFSGLWDWARRQSAQTASQINGLKGFEMRGHQGWG